MLRARNYHSDLLRRSCHVVEDSFEDLVTVVLKEHQRRRKQPLPIGIRVRVNAPDVQQ